MSVRKRLKKEQLKKESEPLKEKECMLELVLIM